MKSYRDPSFEDRVASAAAAKAKALEKLRSKPPVDEAVLAERKAARERREAAEAEKRAAKKAAEQAVKDAKAAEMAAKAAEAAAKAKPIITALTEEERKAARDARYAARKNRK